MRIQLITVNYPPEVGGGPHLSYELAQSLKGRGHDVTVLTGYPHYNVKTVEPKYRRGLWMSETMDGITVRRIRIPVVPRTKKLARGFEHFISGLYLGVLALTAPRADVAMAYTPPLPVPWIACLVGKVRHMGVAVNVQDLFPREAVELGILSNPFLIRALEVMERQVYRLAAAVTVHSPGNREHVIQQGGDPKHVHVLYNWVDTERIRPGNGDNGFKRQQGLQGQFVVSYAGTMGWGQDMSTIIDSAARMRDQKETLFMLVGDGVDKEKAQARSRELGLANVRWLPMQPWSVYPEILAASDVSLVNLNPELRTPVVPSKILSIMAAGRPVIASLPLESDARRIVAEAGCGICVDAGDGEALAGAIRKLESDRTLARDMGKRGRAYVETHYSLEACTGRFENLLKTTVEERL